MFIAASGVYCLMSFFCAAEFFSQEREKKKESFHPPVSILKPLKGTDPELRENLRSFCRQDYPEYEVLLGFTDPDDPAIAAAEELAASEPGCSIRIVITREVLGVNMKVTNLKGLLDAARYPLVAISDSDMRVEPDYLSRIVDEYHGGNTGLVTSLYKISKPSSAGAAFESLTIALDFIPSVLTARRLEGMTFGLGASMLFSKGALNDIGGISAVADHLADDYQIGNRLWKKGYRVILSDYVIEDVAGSMSIREYLKHQIRWARTYRACRPGGFLGYGITHLFPLSLLPLLVHGPTDSALAVPAAALALRLCLALLLCGKVIRKKSWLSWLPLIPLKDMMSFGIWAWSFMGKRVLWRGAYYTITRGGRMIRVPE
ncbi:MAG TPA: bacteriohopanetetrol glucosamine biosynthesis glycosyltransferase HpnI [Dissulfurispiraceae bacterium]